MVSDLFFRRYFNKSTVNQGDTVVVTTEVFFVSPMLPSINCWLTNVGDNLGGSDPVTGPLAHQSNTMTLINLHPSSIQKAFLGNGGSTGCMRVWTAGSTYPTPTPIPANSVWRPISPGIISMLQTEVTYVVKEAAQSGTVITAPTSVVVPSATNFAAGQIMASCGTDLVFKIWDGTIPTGSSRSLTII
jgi:hypothetical protein